jgi:anti-sigma B factor antagonist
MSTTDDLGTGGFRADLERSDGTCIVRLQGELDLASTEEAREALRQAQRDDAVIVIDIDGLRFIDSAGLALLVEVSRRDGGAGRFRITPGNGHVARMLRLTGLDRTLPLAYEARRERPAQTP